MTQPIGQKAAIPNPSLGQFRVLVGAWDTEGTHPLVPDAKVHGRVSFEWMEGGAFLIMRSEINDDPRFPSGLAIFGHDDDQEDCTIVYFDSRGVSRVIHTTLQDNVWKQWRNAPGFSQRSTTTISADGNTMTSVGELSKDGKTWEGDLSLTYTRVK